MKLTNMVKTPMDMLCLALVLYCAYLVWCDLSGQQLPNLVLELHNSFLVRVLVLVGVVMLACGHKKLGGGMNHALVLVVAIVLTERMVSKVVTGMPTSAVGAPVEHMSEEVQHNVQSDENEENEDDEPEASDNAEGFSDYAEAFKPTFA